MTLEKEPNHTKDIKAFIESQLHLDDIADKMALNGIRAEILDKSSGIFLWVNLAVCQLNEVHLRDGRLEAVRQRLREIPRAAKETYASGAAVPLYGLFRDIIQRDIIQRDDGNISDLVRLVQIVYCARRPLRPRELYVALYQSYGRPLDPSTNTDQVLRKHVLDVSKGLADVMKPDKGKAAMWDAVPTVQFIHETVREFLRDGGLEQFTTQRIDVDGHEVLKRSCLDQVRAPMAAQLQFLERHCAWRPGHLSGSAGKVTKKQHETLQRQASMHFPFLEYAAQNLFFHADEAEALGSPQDSFLETFPAKEWFPVYNLFEKFSTRRYQREGTPLVYILAQQGCKSLFRLKTASRQDYTSPVEGEEFPCALICAICNGHFDTAYALVGLAWECRPQTITAPLTRIKFRKYGSLICLLKEIGDRGLMKKALEGGRISAASMESDVESEDCLDLLVELSVLPEFPSWKELMGNGEPGRGPSGPHIMNLPFIRKAISLDPNLPAARIWGRGGTMLSYAVRMKFPSLLALSIECSSDKQRALDSYLDFAVAEEDFDAGKDAVERGADFAALHKLRRLALHHAASEYYRNNDLWRKRVTYLITQERSLICSRDGEDKTVLDHLAPAPAQSWRKQVVSSVVEAGTHVDRFLTCGKCDDHELPFLVSVLLDGDDASFEVLTSSGSQYRRDWRDSSGRTALSWCFAHHHGSEALDERRWLTKLAGCGQTFLKSPCVDVNSRDEAGYTILEHFIRHPRPSQRQEYRAFVEDFFRHDGLDPNFETSDGMPPLGLIISLYDTWPADFGDINAEWSVEFRWPYSHEHFISGRERQQAFSQHLIEALALLLGTRRVSIDTQKQCLSVASCPPDMKDIIQASLDAHLSVPS